MICYWCRGTPARLKDMNQYRLITITDRELGARDCHKEDQDWICPTCLAALRRCRAERMEVGRREQLDIGDREHGCLTYVEHMTTVDMACDIASEDTFLAAAMIAVAMDRAKEMMGKRKMEKALNAKIASIEL